MSVALITGASRGIGKAIAKGFAKANVDVIINYHKHEKEANELADELINDYDIRVLAIKCDISKEDDVERMFRIIIDEFGGLDILVNNAGICRDSLFEEKSINNFKRILDVNLIGTYLCSKHAASIMLKSKKGSIINIASTNAIDTYYPASCDYDASKAGVISLTHNMAREFSPFIRVNCVAPGWVKTDMVKGLSIDQINEESKKILLNRFAEPEEIAKVVIFLASSKASYVNDSIIRVDGGKYNA